VRWGVRRLVRHLGLRDFADYYLITRRNLSPRINPIVNVQSHRCKPLLYGPALPLAMLGPSPLVMGGRLVHTPDVCW